MKTSSDFMKLNNVKCTHSHTYCTEKLLTDLDLELCTIQWILTQFFCSRNHSVNACQLDSQHSNLCLTAKKSAMC